MHSMSDYTQTRVQASKARPRDQRFSALGHRPLWGVMLLCAVSHGQVVVFEDTFTTTTLDPLKWATVDEATVDDLGLAEPSPTYSLRLNGFTGGGDSVESATLDLSSYATATLSYYYEETGGGETPDPGEDLIFEYWDGAVWIELNRQLGSISAMTTYVQSIVPLPTTALHGGFRFRIRSIGTPSTTNVFDDWFVDDVRIESDGLPGDCDLGFILTDAEPALLGFTEISTTGTPLNLSDDSLSQTTMPFTTTDFENASVQVANNGAIGFGGTLSLAIGNEAIPNLIAFGGAQAIFAFWDDIDSDTGNVYVGTVGAAPDRTFIVEWKDRPHFPGDSVLDGDEVTFQIQVFETPVDGIAAQIVYLDTDFLNASYDDGASASIGYQENGTDGIQWSFNTAGAVTDGTVLSLVQPSTDPNDCNLNGLSDSCDIANGTSLDVDGNGIPDECDCGGFSRLVCEPDDAAAGTDISTACPGVTLSKSIAGTPVYSVTEIDTSTGDRVFGQSSANGDWISTSATLRADFHALADSVDIDVVGNDSSDQGFLEAYRMDGGLIQRVETGVIGTGTIVTLSISTSVPEIAYIFASGKSPDSVELDNLQFADSTFEDCNGNSISDACDITNGTSLDTNGDGVPDECEIQDCNSNGIPDECDVACGPSGGDCAVAGCGLSRDCDRDMVPDECQSSSPAVAYFFDGVYVDEFGEALFLKNALEGAGHTVTTFTGTSAAGWTTALAGVDVLVIPELDGPELLSALEAGAVTAVQDFVNGGGGYIQSYCTSVGDLDLLDGLFGTGFTTCDSIGGPYNLDAAAATGTVFESGPPSLPATNDTNSMLVSQLPAGAKAIYTDGIRTTLATWSFGDGTIVWLGYDYFFFPTPVDWIDAADLAVQHTDEGTNGCDDAVLSCLTVDPIGTPLGAVRVDLFIDGASDLNTYQVQVAASTPSGPGTLTTTACTVDESRPDFIFSGLDVTPVCNLGDSKIAVVASNSETISGSGYLATFEFQISADADNSTTFEVAVQPEPGSFLADELSAMLPFTISTACSIDVVACEAPTVIAEGGRYLQVSLNPPTGSANQAIQITSPDCPSLLKYVGADGCLTNTPVFMTAGDWGTVHVTGEEIVPEFNYEVTALCGDASVAVGPASAATWIWGDVAPPSGGDADAIDIQKVVQCAEGTFNPPTTAYNADLAVTCGIASCDIFDIFAVADAFSGLPYAGPVPCVSGLNGPPDGTGPQASEAEITLVPLDDTVSACGQFIVEAFLTQAVDLRGYQIQAQVEGGNSGDLDCLELFIDTERQDYVFHEAPSDDLVFENVLHCRFSSSLISGGIEVGAEPAYLGTFVLTPSEDAEGTFNVAVDLENAFSVLLDSSGHELDFVAQDAELHVTTCDGDVNCDGNVDPLDSGFVLSRFDCEVGQGDADCDAADANGNAVVDPLDVGYVLSRFGECGV